MVILKTSVKKPNSCYLCDSLLISLLARQGKFSALTWVLKNYMILGKYKHCRSKILYLYHRRRNYYVY